MTGNEYAALAMHTNDGKCTERLMTAADVGLLLEGIKVHSRTGDAVCACLGLAGEVGEIEEIFKKNIFHGRPLDTYHIKRELGDVMWYIALMCDAFGFSLDEVMQMNIDKLKTRYPEGFSEYRSAHRKEGDI